MSSSITVHKESLAKFLGQRTQIIMPYPDAKIWNENGVSLARRLEQNPKLEKVVNEALKPERLQPYLVPVDLQAPTRCIDGRLTKRWRANSKQSLGPKIAGGTVHAALAHRIVDIENTAFQLQFEDDIRFVIQRYKEIGIGFGGHIDDHVGGYNTGCGAVDNINLILERLQRPEPQEQLRGLTKLILGDAYDRSIVNEVIGRMLYLDALKPRYMPKENDDPQGEFLYKQTVVELMRKEAARTEDIVPALTGSHNEVAAVMNFVPNTTFDTDRFSNDHANHVQIFAWDIWEMYEEAKNLYPYNMYESAPVQRQAIENRLKHLTTRTMLGLATIMVLTDGTLKVIIARSSKPQLVA